MRLSRNFVVVALFLMLLNGFFPVVISAGTITVYTDRTAFTSAVGSTTVEDFTNTTHFPITTGVLNTFTDLPNIGIAPGDIEPGVTYSAPVPDPNQNYFNIDAGGGFPTPFLDSLIAPRPLTVTFDGPVSAFGFDTYGGLMAPSFDLTINFVSGPSFTQTFTVSSSQEFFGFQSGSADIVSAVINSANSSFGFAIDNFTFRNSYDLVSDWSDNSNPNGVWTYREGSNPLPHVNSWESSFGTFSSPQPGWAESETATNRLPFWFKSNGSETFAHDWQAGDVVVHTTDTLNGVGNGIANVTWTSPGNGTVNLSGAVWNGRNIGRSNDWRLLVNGSIITGGSLASGDGRTRANPFNLATGSGGNTILQGIPVSTNDVLELRLIRTSSAGDFVGVNFTVNFVPESTTPITTTPPVISSFCGPSNPAAISGSTGAQGVLDPTNTNSSQGIVWPPTAVLAGIALDTGQVKFADSNGAEITPGTVLPGVSNSPAFADGKLNFTSIRLPAGKGVLFFGSVQEPPPELTLLPAYVLACQDVVIEGNGDGTLANNGVLLVGLDGFLGGGQGLAQPAANAAGFGPRSGSLPAPGSLYPTEPGGGGNGGGGPSEGGRGGPSAVIAAAGRITNNGVITVNPRIFAPLIGETVMDAQAGSGGAQGGAGGAMRLAALLVEGGGKIDTSAGMDSDGVKRSPDGPAEIQAFLQDLFAGTASTTPIRGNPVAAPIPDNLPEIHIDSISTGSDFFSLQTNNGSLETPDVTLPESSTSLVDVTVEVFTEGVPDGASLVFRAVGTDGTASEASGTVDCVEGCYAAATLTLNAGAVYQIVVYPSTAFALARWNTPAAPMSMQPLYARLQTGNEEKSGVRSQESEFSRQEKPPGMGGLSSLEKWARAFGADPEAHQKIVRAETRLVPGHALSAVEREVKANQNAEVRR